MKDLLSRPLYLLALCAAPVFGGEVVINEIMYHPSSENVQEEYIEVYNRGTNLVDLSGWRFAKGVDFAFPSNTTLAPGGYLVVAANVTAFSAKYFNVTNVIGDWTGQLSNGGETIELHNASGGTESKVSYADAGDWGVRVRGPSLNGTRGWEWQSSADGAGSSLELINPNLPNDNGQNWVASPVPNGTPGSPNTMLASNVAPLIYDVAHSPAVPRSTDPIAITARVVDELASGFSVTLFYRNATASNSLPFSSTAMFDDGAHNDGLPGDGVFGATLSPQANGTVLDFYVQTSDGANTRKWPAPALNEFLNPVQDANANLQVDNEAYAGDQPILRLVMTGTERGRLAAVNQNSDAEFNTTLVSIDGEGAKIRYLSSVRIRGAGSRGAAVKNYRVNIPSDNPWNGVTAFNLNSQYIHVQMIGSILAQKAGLPTENVRIVQVRVNGVNLARSGLPTRSNGSGFGAYILQEPVGAEWAARHFPTDPDGNVYRASSGTHLADLSYQGSDPNNYIARGYSKNSNASENDWSDLIDLTFGLSSSTTDDNYTNVVSQIMNVPEWMTYFAVFTLMDSQETSLGTGEGDDYGLYRGLVDTRFKILGHDYDTILNEGDTAGNLNDSIWRAADFTDQPEVGRFLQFPDFAPLYLGELQRLAGTVFSPAQLNPVVDQFLASFVPDTTISAIKSFAANRSTAVLNQIPSVIRITNTLAINSGFPRTIFSTVALTGSADAVRARTVLVNGTAAAWIPWQGTWSIPSVLLNPGINRVVVQALDANGAEVQRGYVDIWYDTGTTTAVGGTLGSDAVWTTNGSPYFVNSSLTIPDGVTLTIQPGTTVYVTNGASITVTGTGRLLAEGTDLARIRFTRRPGGGNWGSLDFISAPSVESRLGYVDIDFCAGRNVGGHSAEIHVNDAKVFFDHLGFTNTPAAEYISFDGSSFIVQNCIFPTYPFSASGQPEMLHGVNGIPASGYGIFRDNYFGHTWGFNDTIDFTGGQRPGAILQVINNVFDGAGDDHLDLDSTDAWIEGNIFMHAHRDPNRTDRADDTSSAISGGVDDAGQLSEWTIINNLFYDVDHAFLNKGGTGGNAGTAGRVIFVNNTLVHVAKEGGAGLTNDIAAFDFTDDSVPLPALAYGAGAYIADNIIWDCPALVANYNPANHTVIFENNLLPVAWTGPGTNNLVADPVLNLGLISVPTNADWLTVRAALAPRPGSPALGTGVGGKYDKGGLNPRGLLIYGEPQGTTTVNSATLTVAPGSTFNWGTDPPVPPYEWGYTQYKWKLDNGPWSAETSVTTSPTIALSGLSDGPHTVFVAGKSDAGYYQDDPFAYPTNGGQPAHLTASRTWTVNSSFVNIRLNEILARNDAALAHEGTYPDAVEIYNAGTVDLNLSGWGLTDQATNKFKFAFPPNTLLPAGQYLVVYADETNGTSGPHLGFALNQAGDALYFYNGAGTLVDSVQFGTQLPDFSIGRDASGQWTLCTPTLGSANAPRTLGDQSGLKINEWLANGRALYPDDFIEIYNANPSPVLLGGLFLTDEPLGWPRQSPVPPLTFMAGGGFYVFLADGSAELGANHVSFKLSSDRGAIGLSDAAGEIIDCVYYGPQATDVSEGRQPNGGSAIASFTTATPGASNPGGTTISTLTLNIMSVTNQLWRWDNSGVDRLTAWTNATYNDSSWSTGFGLFGFETTPAIYPFPFNTFIPSPNTAGGHITVYYRTHFTWTNALDFALSGTAYLDDGGVFYLNGREVLRQNMPSGTITNGTLASSSPGEPVVVNFNFPGGALRAGDNVLAVEVHQNATTTSDDVFGMSLSASRSVTNSSSTVFLNEVMANNVTITNTGGTNISDWVEIYNPSATAFSLAGMSLSDDVAVPRRWVFPTGATIGAGAYLLVRFDNQTPASTNNTGTLNTGFGLSASGDEVYLFDSPARGGALSDSITFGIQPPDLSIARVPNGSGSWKLALPTPRSQNIAIALGDRSLLRINEWLANPAGNDNDFFEIYNPNPQPVDLSGLFLTDDVLVQTKYRIPNLSFIGTGEDGFVRFVADNQPEQGADHVNFALDSAGESIGLFTATGTRIESINFAAQENGVSEGRFPDGTTNIMRFRGTATPGHANVLPLSTIVINEVLSHSDLPLEDAVELHNPTPSAIDISGWYLTDNRNEPRRFRIPDGTIISPGGFAVYYENQFNPLVNGQQSGFALSSVEGDDLYLYTADAGGHLTGFRTSVKFGPAENAVSFGRYPTSVGFDFPAMSLRTFGADTPATVQDFRTGTGLTNVYPKVGPVVISEVMYHPPDIGTNDNSIDEFIELQNITGDPAPLFDPVNPTNTWRLRDAVDFDFPTNITLPPGGFLLVVNFDPETNATQLTAFRNRYGVGGGVPVYGPYGGKLANDSENIELKKPDAPQGPTTAHPGLVPYVDVDRVKYSDDAPWPVLADGNTNGVGYSLQRRVAGDYGNDPVNWIAGVPTPGGPSGAPVLTAPSISNLTSSHGVRLGSSDTFTVMATGSAPLNYQWRQNGVLIAGATNASLTLANVQIANAGVYSLVVYNGAGAANGSLELEVQVPPGITTQPQGLNVLPGSNATFVVLVAGSAPLSYQWRKDGTDIPGAVGASFTITNAQLSDEGGFSVAVTNLYGSTTSTVATLTVNASPFILTQPRGTNIYVTETARFSVVAVGALPIRYQWRFNGNNIFNATNASYTVTNAQISNAGGYTVFITNRFGALLSTNAPLTVSTRPTVTVAAADASASEPGANTGRFTISRTGSTAQPLAVLFSVSGTATPGVDYTALPAQVTIGAGSNSVGLIVTPRDDMAVEGSETVVVSLTANVAYTVAAPGFATVVIADDDNLPPSITLTNPIEGGLFPAPGNVPLAAIASDIGGFVVNVEFYYDGTNKIGEAVSPPYVLTWSNAPAGLFTLTAVATDDFGVRSTSAPVHVTLNGRPSVSLLNPLNGTPFVSPATVNLSAVASDPDGSITGVEFYQGATLIGAGVLSGTNYGLVWSNVQPGVYSLSARATDNFGTVTISTQANIAVFPPSAGFSDAFLTRGVLTGFTNFVTGTNTAFTKEDGEPRHASRNGVRSGWLTWTAPISGPCTLDTEGSAFDTVLAVYTNNPPTAPGVTNLVVVNYNDDANGAVVWSRLTFFAVSGRSYQIAVDGYGLNSGGRIVFHMSMTNPYPYIVSHPQSQILDQGGNATFAVTAAGPGPLSYQWRFNDSNITGAVSTSFTRSNVTAASEGLYTVVVQNNSGSVTSAPASLTVRAGPGITAQPQGVVTDPGGSATFNVGAAGTAPLTYQWRFNGTALPGATNSSFTQGNVQYTNGGLYSVMIFNLLGSAASQSAELIVRPRILSGELQTNGVFLLDFQGSPNKPYIVERAGNATNWTAVGTNASVSGQSQFLEPDAITNLSQIYRLRVGP